MKKEIPLPPLHQVDKISLDMAETEFQRFVESMNLDVDPVYMDAEDKTTFEKQKRRLLKAIQNGSLIVNEHGEFVYTPVISTSVTESIVFHERTGASIIAMDAKKKGHDIAKMYAVMAEMCRVHPSVFTKLKGIDIKICEVIFALLMD